jgi:protein phosphatase
MPWSVKAQALLLHQYAVVGAASRSALGEAVNLLEQAQAAGQDVDELLIKFRTQKQLTGQYVEAYRH